MSYTYSGTFEITAPASITITSPNSGTFYVNDVVNITWTTTGTVGNVRIKLYNTANSLVATLTSSTSNDGSYSWTISSSHIAQHETEYQLRIEQVSGSSPSDYSGNLEIYPYAQPVERTANDDIGISQGTVGRVTSIWTHVRSAGDNIGVSQTVSTINIGNIDVQDNIGISQGTVGKLYNTWKHIFTNADDISIGQGTVGRVTRDWKVAKTISDDIGISQSVETINIGNIEVQDDISISQGTVGKVPDVWKHIRVVVDSISIGQGTVGKVSDIWKHIRSQTDDLVIGQGVGKVSGTWRDITTLTTVDDIGIQETFAYAVGDWANVTLHTDGLNITQEFLYDVTSGDGIKFIYGTTVIDLGNLNKLPFHEPIHPKQLVKLTGAGQAKVTDFADADKFVNLNVRIDDTTSASVTNFFKDTVKFAKNRFYYQNEAGYRQRVRLWDASGFDVPVESGGQRNVSIQMRIE